MYEIAWSDAHPTSLLDDDVKSFGVLQDLSRDALHLVWADNEDVIAEDGRKPSELRWHEGREPIVTEDREVEVAVLRWQLELGAPKRTTGLLLG